STSPPEQEHTFLGPRHSRGGSHLDGTGDEPAHRDQGHASDTSPLSEDELSKAVQVVGKMLAGVAFDAEIEKITRQSPSKAAVEPNSTMRLEPTSNILVFAPLGRILWLRDMEAASELRSGEHGRGITQTEN
ncbi:unnamed protein product, partial [Amoebophrya sp. A25]